MNKAIIIFCSVILSGFVGKAQSVNKHNASAGTKAKNVQLAATPAPQVSMQVVQAQAQTASAQSGSVVGPDGTIFEYHVMGAPVEMVAQPLKAIDVDANRRTENVKQH